MPLLGGCGARGARRAGRTRGARGRRRDVDDGRRWEGDGAARGGRGDQRADEGCECDAEGRIREATDAADAAVLTVVAGELIGDEPGRARGRRGRHSVTFVVPVETVSAVLRPRARIVVTDVIGS